MKISVAICTFNGEKYIKDQLLSIVHQNRAVDEIIICDDRSTDKTLEICEKILKKSGVDYKIYKNDHSLNVVKNFKKCYSLCNGDIIFSCDQDDVWKCDKVEKIEKVFLENPDINLVATNAELIDSNDNLMNLSLREGIGFVMNQPKDALDCLLNTYCITGATMAIRKEFANEYYFISKYWLHDGWLALMASLNNSLMYIDDKLISYRLHGNNQCGIGDVDILAHGSIDELKKRKAKKLFHTVLTCPYYFEDYASQKKEMYQEFLDEIEKNNWSVEKKNLNKLKECIAFWKKRSIIKEYSLKQMILLTKTFKKSNAYEKYCESKWFSVYDYYFWIVYKLIPRRKKGQNI